jgi:hypothetical protein
VPFCPLRLEHAFPRRLHRGPHAVAARDQQRLDPEIRSPEQIALQRDAIAVATGELQQRIVARTQQRARSDQRRQMRPVRRTFPDMDRIDPACERRRRIKQDLRIRHGG